MEKQVVPSVEFNLERQSSDVNLPLLDKRRSDLVVADIERSNRSMDKASIKE